MDNRTDITRQRDRRMNLLTYTRTDRLINRLDRMIDRRDIWRDNPRVLSVNGKAIEIIFYFVNIFVSLAFKNDII
jgi:hypothetical protein